MSAAVFRPSKHCRCQELDTYSEDCLIVAGDISDNLQTFKTTLQCFKEKFKVIHQVQHVSSCVILKLNGPWLFLQYVLFVPGNHDLWTRREDRGKQTSLGMSHTYILQSPRPAALIMAQLHMHRYPYCNSPHRNKYLSCGKQQSNESVLLILSV